MYRRSPVNVAENSATTPSATDHRRRALVSSDWMPSSTAVLTIRPVETLAAVQARPVPTPSTRPALPPRTEREIRRHPARLLVALAIRSPWLPSCLTRGSTLPRAFPGAASELGLSLPRGPAPALAIGAAAVR